MKLVLDIGNTHVHGGVFENGSNEPKGNLSFENNG